MYAVQHFKVIAHYWSNFRWWVGLPLFNALFFSNLWYYYHKSHITEN